MTLDPREKPQRGDIISDRYRLEYVLGEGGFGVVYRALQLSTEQPVAIKILHSREGEQHEHHARFRREMQLCAQLNHPNIVRLIDNGQLPDGRLYMVLEFVEGQSLAALLRSEGALTQQEARHLMLQVLDALSAAHELGIIHRDIKPQNIMITNAGVRRNAKLLDFGIAGILEEARDDHYRAITREGELAATPQYVSPEQLKGDGPSPQSDLYAWGLVFLECLTGKPAVEGRNLHESLLKHLTPEPFPLPPELEADPLGKVLAKAIDKDRQQRFRSMREAFEALEPIGLESLRQATTATALPLPPRQRAPAPVTASTAQTLNTQAPSTPDRRPSFFERKSTRARPERRQLSMMSVTFRLPSHQDELEDLLSVIDPLWEKVEAIAERSQGLFRGFHMAHACLYFGIPVTREDDAIRAVRAGLHILEEISRHNASGQEPPLPPVQLAIDSGQALVDPAAPDEERAPSVVSSMDTHLAKLLELAPLHSLVISEATAGRVEGHFRLEPLTLAHASKGQRSKQREQLTTSSPRDIKPVGYLVTEPLSDTERHGLRSPLEAPLIGRAAELSLLEQKWLLVQEQEGQAVVLIGEPGIGKTRLMRELRRSLPSPSPLWLTLWGRSELSQQPLGPVQRLLESLLRPEVEPDAPHDSAPLMRWLQQQGLELTPHLLPLAQLLGRTEGIAEAPVLTPRVLRERTFETLQALLLGRCQLSPVVLWVEDLHWMDSVSLEFIERLIVLLPDYPVFLLMTSRPGPVAQRFQRQCAHLSLLPLSRAQSEQLISQLEGAAPLSPQARAQIAQRCDGIPLFAEEYCRMVLKAGWQGVLTPETLKPGRVLSGKSPTSAAVETATVLNGAMTLAALAIPERLRDSLTARLDQLGPCRETAQQAAVIGREFTLQQLRALSSLSPGDLDAHLVSLREAGILVRKGPPDQGRFSFRHSLIQDAAYETLTRQQRRFFHARLAEALERISPQVVEQQPALLAYHHAEGGNVASALPYLVKAARLALERSALEEVLALVQQGLQQLQRLNFLQDRLTWELSLRQVQLPALFSLKGYAAPEVETALEQSKLLLRRQPPDRETFPLAWATWAFYSTRGQHAEALRMAEQLRTDAEYHRDPELELEALVANGNSHHYSGHYATARACFERLLSLYHPETHRDHAYRYGQDPAALACGHLGQILVACGEVGGGFQYMMQAIGRAEQLKHAFTLGYVLGVAGIQTQIMGMVSETEQLAVRMQTLAREQLQPLWLAYGLMLEGWARVQRGETLLDPLRTGLKIQADAGMNLCRPYFMALLADALSKLGQREEALEVLAEAQALAETLGEHCTALSVRLHQGRQRLFYMPSQTSQALEAFRTARLMAQEQQAALLECSALVGIGGACERLREVFEEREALARLLPTLSLPPGTPILVEAKRLVGLS